ncbi:MAG: YkgJ family cysteine cluster protein [Candidatus Dadabacteria bacterium]|nr:MAG: YkgJ family cysteine cluster protein [Candidatus Dadabacteria bacterium]
MAGAVEGRVPWYASGLRFACTRCGACCRGATGYVWVTPNEARALAAWFGTGADEFGRKYLRRVGGRYALLERPTGECVLLEGDRCSAYPVRPRQCRSYPFWDQNLRSPAAWGKAAACCEGISAASPLIGWREIERLRSG